MLQFIIYNPEDDFEDSYPESSLSIQEYLENPPQWQPALEDTFLIFEGLTETLNMDLNPFGLLHFIYPQFLEIERRLKEGKFAILRSAGDWKPTFYIFEPNEEIVYFSILGSLPQPYSSYYPQQNSPLSVIENTSQQEVLYNYIETNRQNLSPDNLYSINQKKIISIPFNKIQLLYSLVKQAKLGKEFIDFLE